jgi:hypothetical protein
MTSERPVLRVLDLCCGTGSVRQAVERIFGRTHRIVYVGVDVERRFEPTVVADVRSWDHASQLPTLFGRGRIDIVWASPPCTHYSVAQTSVPYDKRNFRLADSIVRACLRIVALTRPRMWFMENPGTGYLKTRPVVAGIEHLRRRCTYCMYGFPYRKITDIWTNVDVELKQCVKGSLCRYARRGCLHPATAQSGTGRMLNSGSRASVSYQVPPRLMRELFTAPPVSTHRQYPELG